jgi:probable FeS assembly SUF system protein SufT
LFGSNEPEITLARDCEAIVIPHGYRTNLPKESKVRVLQRLGGSVTVTAEFGGLFRIDPENLDALGLTPSVPVTEGTASDQPLDERVWSILRSCYDPEIPVDIVELGLVYDCTVGAPGEDGKRDVAIKMTLTAPGCGMGDVLAKDVETKIGRLADVGKVSVEVVFDPPWNQSMMSEAARLQLGFF